jgi:hypothetical protein
MSKCLKELPNFAERALASFEKIITNGVHYHICAYTVAVSYSSLYMNQVPERLY